MKPAEFVAKWARSKGSERQTAQEHFIDICRMLGEQTPNEADPTGEIYAFEKGARTKDGDGFADVWLKDKFAWEYKGKRKDLGVAYAQVLQKYREALGNPNILLVCDIDRYEAHTNWSNTETWVYQFTNAQIATDEPIEVLTVAGVPAKDAPEITALQFLKFLFADPGKLKPEKTRDDITKEAAEAFGEISDSLRKWNVDDMRIARFITKTLFCMFATDVQLLPRGTFSEVIAAHTKKSDAEGFRKHLSQLFRVMNAGGEFMMRDIPQFNGELFGDHDVPDRISGEHIHILERLDNLNWADVEPSIFGTLFERILDPTPRAKLGAHYTSRDDIELIVEPVLMEPLRREWREAKAQIDALAAKASTRSGLSATALEKVKSLIQGFHKQLYGIRVLDPACGSGNFLYVSLTLLKGLEKEVIAEAAIHGIQVKHRVHPKQLYGIEINRYAYELASIVIWIGYLQYKHRNALAFTDETPILQPLKQMELKDAIVDMSKPARPVEPTWPRVDVIVGNPPFLGGKRLRTVLGNPYVDSMFAVWDERVPREADLCAYWFEKARAAIDADAAKRAGLLATQAIRAGANRRILERIKESGDIFYGQADRPWILDGADVRVSMVGFDDGAQVERWLNETKDGTPRHALIRALNSNAASIAANLAEGSVDITKARRLKENLGVSFMGDTKVGPFEIRAGVAKKMLAGHNPNNRPNSDVIRPWTNGRDIASRPRNMWIIDFPPGTSEAEAARYEMPFEHIKQNVKPFRATAKSGDATGVPWWIHQRPRPDMRVAVASHARYLATPRVAKHRFFVWIPSQTLPDSRLFVFARGDDYFFGVLSSRVHEVWSIATASRHGIGNDPTYNNTTCFETFPFPKAQQKQQWAISLAARDLDAERTSRLNPPGLIPSPDLAKLTQTNLYNERPTWLHNAHRKLDEAVFAAYGWPEPPGQLSDSEIIARLLRLNLSREAV